MLFGEFFPLEPGKKRLLRQELGARRVGAGGGPYHCWPDCAFAFPAGMPPIRCKRFGGYRRARRCPPPFFGGVGARMGAASTRRALGSCFAKQLARTPFNYLLRFSYGGSWKMSPRDAFGSLRGVEFCPMRETAVSTCPPRGNLVDGLPRAPTSWRKGYADMSKKIRQNKEYLSKPPIRSRRATYSL